MSIDFSNPSPTQIMVQPSPTASDGSTNTADNTNDSFWGKGGFHFADLIDIINPLQHIPIVSSIYQELTGDTIAPGPKMLGGGLLGGVIGFVASAADLVMEQATGKNLSAHVMAAFEGGDSTQPTQVMAQATQHTQSGALPAVRQAPLSLIDLDKINELPVLDFSGVSAAAQSFAGKHYQKAQALIEPQNGVYAINT